MTHWLNWVASPLLGISYQTWNCHSLPAPPITNQWIQTSAIIKEMVKHLIFLQATNKAGEIILAKDVFTFTEHLRGVLEK